MRQLQPLSRSLRFVASSCLLVARAPEVVAQAARPAPAIPAARIDSFVRARLAERRIPGVALAIVYDGRTLFEKAWGVSNVETETPMTTASVFELASITKQFTAAATMLLVEEGKIKLDDPITTYVDSTPPAWSGITIRHLLTHQSGINGPSVPFLDGSPLLRITTRQAFNAAAAIRPLFPPGANALYSDEGYFLLGMVIERASGMRWGDFLQQRVFSKLGMEGTSILDRRRVIRGRVATYEMQRDTLVNWRRDWQHELPAFFGIWSTLADVVRWDNSLRQATLLTRASIEQMWTPGTLSDGRTGMIFSRPYGFGFELADIRGHRYAAHGGASGTFLLHFLDEPLTIVVLGNLANTAGPNAVLIAREVAGFLRPEYRQPHHIAPGADPRPAFTDSLRGLLVTMGSGDPSPLMTAAHQGWFESSPRGFRTTWFRRLTSIGPLTFLTCDDVRGRGVRMLDPVEHICYYKTVSGAETLFITAWLAADGRVSFVRFGRSDEL